MTSPKTVVLIPYRAAKGRDPRVLLRSLEAWGQQTQTVLIDGSLEPIEVPAGIVSIHCPYEGPFNLSFHRNVGIRWAEKEGFEYVHTMDGDIFPPDKYLDFALRYLQQCQADILEPYVVNSNDEVPDSTEEYSAFLKPDLSQLKTKRHSYSCVLMRTEVPLKIKGYLENFQHYGCEDDEFKLRANRAGFCSIQIPGLPLVHSYHKRDDRKGDYYKRNFQLLKEIRAGRKIDIPDDWGRKNKPRPESYR